MYLLLVFPLSVLFVAHASNALSDDVVWNWTCNKGFCNKKKLDHDFNTTALSLPACRLLCSTAAGLWPRPTGAVTISTDKPLVQLNVNDVDVQAPGVVLKNDDVDLVTAAATRFKSLLGKVGTAEARESGGQSMVVELYLLDKGAASELTLHTDESYKLTVKQVDGHVKVNISADNFFGARHGLETLTQIIIYDDIANQILIPFEFSATDAPRYPYRGVLLDTARNYIGIKAIERTMEAMAASKLNRFHWHISDTQSFPFVSKSNPKLSQLGAYSRTEVYTHSDIAQLVTYAAVRGIRIVPEFDAPSHVGEGWQDSGFLVCFNAQPWGEHCLEPPCGQFDPTKPELYDALENLYGDMLEAFKPDIFHMGGDEVSIGCWRSNKNITHWMKTEKNWDEREENFLELWNHFQSHALARLDKVSGSPLTVALWTSALTARGKFASNRYVIQVWNMEQTEQLLEQGHKIILSDYQHLYLDCGYASWVGMGSNWCSPYKGWQQIYQFRPSKIGGDRRDQILGSEALLWTEQVDEASVDGRFWPRAAALAERLWADPTTCWKDAESRMLAHRERIKNLGIAAEALQPQWCLQNEGSCPLGGKGGSPVDDHSGHVFILN